MGRALTEHGTTQTLGKIGLHFLLAIVYTCAIAAVVHRLVSWRAIVAGSAVGLLLYLLNVSLVGLAFPQFLGMETRVAFTHVVFGLFAAALYKGMVGKRPGEVPSPSQPHNRPMPMRSR